MITHLENATDNELFLSLSKLEDDSRLGYLRSVYEENFHDSLLANREEFNFSEHKMRNRDWNLLTSHSNVKTFAKGELITIDSNVFLFYLNLFLTISKSRKFININIKIKKGTYFYTHRRECGNEQRRDINVF